MNLIHQVELSAYTVNLWTGFLCVERGVYVQIPLKSKTFVWLI